MQQSLQGLTCCNSNNVLDITLCHYNHSVATGVPLTLEWLEQLRPSAPNTEPMPGAHAIPVIGIFAYAICARLPDLTRHKHHTCCVGIAIAITVHCCKQSHDVKSQPHTVLGASPQCHSNN